LSQKQQEIKSGYTQNDLIFMQHGNLANVSWNW